jgi:hypothetical protein
MVEPEAYDGVTIFFSDIPSFGSIAQRSTAFQLVTFLNDLCTMMDSIIEGYDVFKVTIFFVLMPNWCNKFLLLFFSGGDNKRSVFGRQRLTESKREQTRERNSRYGSAFAIIDWIIFRLQHAQREIRIALRHSYGYME